MASFLSWFGVVFLTPTLPEVGGHFKFQLNLGHPQDGNREGKGRGALVEHRVEQPRHGGGESLSSTQVKAQWCRSHGNRVPRSRASMARVMSFGVRPAFLQILGNAGERSGDSVALVLKASASSRNRAGRPVLNGFRAYTVAARRAVHFAPGAPPTLPGGVAPGVSVLAGGRSSRRESRSIMLRSSL